MVIEALKVMSDYFKDDKELGKYIRLLTKIPAGSLDLRALKVRLEKFRKDVGVEHFAEDFHEGKPLTEGYSLDEIMENVGLKRND
jgi:hypothetical protein|tara:strand:+ start:279 stop:533 length:255 start_codon:yes stop_codon:yes gene_type:complete